MREIPDDAAEELEKILALVGPQNVPIKDGQSQLAYRIQGVRHDLMEALEQWGLYAWGSEIPKRAASRLIPQGALFTVTSGAYGSYAVHGIFRATVEIDIESLRAKWSEDHPQQRKFDEEGFLTSMKDMMEPADAWELFLAFTGRNEKKDLINAI